jgi:hypothetical protein
MALQDLLTSLEPTDPQVGGALKALITQSRRDTITPAMAQRHKIDPSITLQEIEAKGWDQLMSEWLQEVHQVFIPHVAIAHHYYDERHAEYMKGEAARVAETLARVEARNG